MSPSRSHRFNPLSRRNNPDALHLSDVLRANTTGGMLMMVATVLALVLAGFWPHAYETFVDAPLGMHTVAEWAADGLLTVFFFVSGLELKREFTEGALRRPMDAIVPIVAAGCGMLFPALIYVLVNVISPNGHPEGWAIPMATDIAFALAILSIAGRHLPPSLRAFLLTLAIVDDLGAILVIAIVFTESLAWGWFAGAVACMVVWGIGQHRKIDNGWLYVPIFLIGWFCMMESGIHATIAGVAMGLLTRNTAEGLDEPLDRWQHKVEPWSAGLIVPIFAFTNAGVHISPDLLVSLWTNPVPLGIILGLFFGKLIGISFGTGVTIKTTTARLGKGIKPLDMVAVAQIGGIGLTVSLLITELTFRSKPELHDEAKAAVLVASVLSAIVGSIVLQIRTRQHRKIDAGSAE